MSYDNMCILLKSLFSQIMLQFQMVMAAPVYLSEFPANDNLTNFLSSLRDVTCRIIIHNKCGLHMLVFPIHK